MGRPKKYKSEEEKEKAKKNSRRKWAKKNQVKIDYIRSKSFAKQFIETAGKKDISMVENWVDNRKEELKNE